MSFNDLQALKKNRTNGHAEDLEMLEQKYPEFLDSNKWKVLQNNNTKHQDVNKSNHSTH